MPVGDWHDTMLPAAPSVATAIKIRRLQFLISGVYFLRVKMVKKSQIITHYDIFATKILKFLQD
jgi:hypothetical protein